MDFVRSATRLGPEAHIMNLYYDEILQLVMKDGVEFMAYEDDLAIVVTARSVEEIRRKIGDALEQRGRVDGHNQMLCYNEDEGTDELNT